MGVLANTSGSQHRPCRLVRLTQERLPGPQREMTVVGVVTVQEAGGLATGSADLSAALGLRRGIAVVGVVTVDVAISDAVQAHTSLRPQAFLTPKCPAMLCPVRSRGHPTPMRYRSGLR